MEQSENMKRNNWLRVLGVKLTGVAVFGVFLMLAMVTVMTGPIAEPVIREEKAWPVSVMSASPRSAPPILITYGKLEARQSASLKTTLSAPVKKVVTPEGAWVNQGDLIIELDDAEAMLALKVAQASYERNQAQLQSTRTDQLLANELTQHHADLAAFAESNLNRYRELHGKGMISDSVLDEVRQQASERAMVFARHMSAVADFPNKIDEQLAAVREAQARTQQAELDVQQTAVRAPFSGRVISIGVATGDRVSPGTSLVEIADYEQLEIRTSVSAELGIRLRQALQAEHKIIAKTQLGDQFVEFVLDRLSGNIKPGQSGLDAFFHTSLNQSLVIGSVMNLVVELPTEHQVVAVPMQSLYETDRVYRVENNRLNGISVTRIGDYIDEQGHFRVLVRSDELKAGDSLMTTQLPVAISGLLVTPVALLHDQADA